MCVLNIVDCFVLVSVLLSLVHGGCCLSRAKWYSWFHVITLCILIYILSWSMISTQHVLPYIDHQLVFSLFSFCGVQRMYQRLDSPSALAKLQNIRFRVSYSFNLVLDFLGHGMMSLVFRHTILFIYFGVLILLLSIWRLDVLDVMNWKWYIIRYKLSPYVSISQDER